MNTPQTDMACFSSCGADVFRRKMNTNGSVTVLFLCFMMLSTLTDCSTCQTNILEGESLSFKLTDTPLKDDERFSIKKDYTVVVPKRNRNQQGPGTVRNNHLELQNMKLGESGTYRVEVFDVNGVQISSYSETVCIYGKVPKPRVNVTCQNETVKFRCDVEGSKEQGLSISYSWHKNGKEFKMNVSNLSLSVEANNSVYTCTANNPVHKNTSDPVEAACPGFKPDISAYTLFGFDLWIMVGILAGGGAFISLLIVLVTMACLSSKLRKKQQRDEEALSLDYINAPLC